MKSAPEWQDLSWQESAACRNKPTSIFYPPDLQRYPRDGDQAKAICAECPVSSECLQYAIFLKDDEGIWGGKTREERRRLRGIQRSTAH